jgi:AcrR family transcriptional regulator
MPRRAGQPPLSAERILAAALRIVDHDSLDALSMRRLASDLDVDPMAIYHHVPNKAALLRALVVQVFDTLPSEPSGDTWQARLRAWAAAYRALALEHPNLVLRIVGDPEMVALAAHRAGRPVVQSKEDEMATSVLADYVNGFVLGEASGAMDRATADALFAFGLDVFLAGLSARRRTDRRSST